MTVEAGSVTVAIRADSTELEAGLSRARGQAQQFEQKTVSSANKARNALKNLGRDGKTSLSLVRTAANDAAAQIGALPGAAGAAQRSIAGLGTAGMAAAAGIGLLVLALGKAVSEAKTMETLSLRTEAQLKATGFASGKTAGQIRDLSKEIAASTLASTESVELAAQSLLRFRTVSGDTFEEALRLSQDMAETGFGSIESAALALGKALEDPAEGIGALERQYGKLSQTQKDNIEKLMEANRLLDAQGVILDFVRSKAGGAGEAVNQGLAGAFDKLTEATSDFFEELGTGAPLDNATRAINSMASGVAWLTQKLSESKPHLEGFFNILKVTPSVGPFSLLAKTMGVLASNTDKAGAATKKTKEQIDAARKADELAAAEKGKQEQAKLAQQRKDEAAAEKRKEAEEELRKKQEQATEAAKRAIEQRQQAIATINAEVGALQASSEAYLKGASSVEEMTTKQEILLTQSRLGITASSAEGQAVAELITRKSQLIGSIESETERRDELRKKIEDQKKASEQLQEQITDSIKNAEQRTEAINVEIRAFNMGTEAADAYRVEQELINAALASGAVLTEQQIQRIREVAGAYASAKSELDGMTEAREAAEEKAEQEYENMVERQKDFANTISEGLASAITGATSFEDAIKNITLAIGEAIIKAYLLKQISGVLGGTGGGPIEGLDQAQADWASQTGNTGGGGGSSMGIIGAIGSLASLIFHKGGVVGPGGPSRRVSAAAFAGAPRLHDGLMPDEYPAILQRGEGVISKDNMKKGMGDQPVTVNLYESKEKAGQVRRRGNEVDVWVADIRGGGPVATAMRDTFGLQRVGQ